MNVLKSIILSNMEQLEQKIREALPRLKEDFEKWLYFTIYLVIALIFYGCKPDYIETGKPLNKVQDIEYGKIQVFTVDSCEYIVWNTGDSGGIVHKQNCKFCQKRSNQKS